MAGNHQHLMVDTRLGFKNGTNREVPGGPGGSRGVVQSQQHFEYLQLAGTCQLPERLPDGTESKRPAELA